MLSTWNSADGFLDGAEAAHEALLAGLWRRSGTPLPPGLRELTSPEVRKWLDTTRKSELHSRAFAAAVSPAGATPTAATNAGEEECDDVELAAEIVAVCARL